MPVYFRSDLRPPEVIFNEGFTPQALNQEEFVVHESFPYEQAIQNWSLYSAINPKKHEGDTAASTDAYSPGCVCLSTHINTTSMFPTNSTQDTYIPSSKPFLYTTFDQ